MVSLEQFEAALDGALQAQRFRPVAPTSITDSGAITLPAPDSQAEQQVGAALQQATAAANWAEIGQQLAQFRHSPGYRSVYIRQDRNFFRLVVVQAWSGLLQEQFARDQLRWAWIIFDNMVGLLPRYQIPNKAELEAILGQYSGPLAPGPSPEGPPAGGNADPKQASDGILALRKAETNPTAKGPTPTGQQGSSFLAIAASIVKVVLYFAELGNVKAYGNLLMVATDGLPDDLTGALEQDPNGLMETKVSLHDRAMMGIGINLPKGAVHGHGLGVLDLGDLGFVLRQELAARGQPVA